MIALLRLFARRPVDLSRVVCRFEDGTVRPKLQAEGKGIAQLLKELNSGKQPAPVVPMRRKA